MNKTIKFIITWILALLIWLVGIAMIYQITWAPKKNFAGVMITERPLIMTPSGQFVEQSFILANAPFIFLLTAFCAGGAYLLTKKIKGKMKRS